MTERSDREPVAVALRYDEGGVPKVVAKGRGPVAETILAIAAEHEITLQENAALAAALSTVELDRPIPPELYEAVAQVIAFILRLADEPARPNS